MENSTFTETLQRAFPDRVVEGYIAEQNMVSLGVGMAAQGLVPFVCTFACFLSRAYDQVRMAAISRSSINLCGSHCEVSIGEDGPSQMALEDIAIFRAVPGATVFYPSDGVSAERLTEEMARRAGICYLRTSRPKTAILYSNDEQFPVPGLKVLRQLCQEDEKSSCCTKDEGRLRAHALADGPSEPPCRRRLQTAISCFAPKGRGGERYG